jgi:hypothetical protein
LPKIDVQNVEDSIEHKEIDQNKQKKKGRPKKVVKTLQEAAEVTKKRVENPESIEEIKVNEVAPQT